MSTTKPSPRTIVVKTLLNPDEFLEFDDECSSSDISHSKALRDLVKGWMNKQRNDRRQRARTEWPGLGQNMAMFPGRPNFAAPRSFNMRM